MSKFTEAAAVMQTLSLAALEEASRAGIRDADIEHLFLALTLDAGNAGQVLRGLGVTLDVARDAVAAERTDHLASLGVASVDAADDTGEERIVFHETQGYDWTDRAVDVLKRASGGQRDGSSSAVLRCLLTEPSGTIGALVSRLGVDTTDLRARLDEADGIRPAHGIRPAAATERSRGPHGTVSAFVPAPPADLWMLVSDAMRIPEWDGAVGQVARGTENEDEWDAAAPTHTPDGKPLRIKDDLRRIRIRREQVDAPFRVTWRMSYPDARAANERVIGFELEEAAGGTQVRIHFGWERTARRRTVLGWLLRPLARLVIFIQLTQISSGLSRVFR